MDKKQKPATERLAQLILDILLIAVVLVIAVSVAWIVAAAIVGSSEAHGAVPADSPEQIPVYSGGTWPPRTCHVWETPYVWPWYVPVGKNTAIELVAYCGADDDRYYSVWHVSWFSGDQPDLAQWYDVQNAASRLLRYE